MVGHDDEGMEFVVAFGAVVLEGFEQEFGVAGDLEETAAVGGDGRDEERAGCGSSLWDGHSWIVRGSACVPVDIRRGLRKRTYSRVSIREYPSRGQRKGMRSRMPITNSKMRTRSRVI